MPTSVPGPNSLAARSGMLVCGVVSSARMAVGSLLAITLCKRVGVSEFCGGAMYLPLSDKLIVRRKVGATLFKNGWPNTNMLALRIEFH